MQFCQGVAYFSKAGFGVARGSRAIISFQLKPACVVKIVEFIAPYPFKITCELSAVDTSVMHEPCADIKA